MRERLNEKEVDAIIKKRDGSYLKVNLPPTIEEYRAGNGEGVFAVIPDDKENENYDKDVPGQVTAVICNDSVYYPDLVYGSKVLCNIRPGHRPVANWDDLHGTAEAAANQKKFIRKIKEGHDNGN